MKSFHRRALDARNGLLLRACMVVLFVSVGACAEAQSLSHSPFFLEHGGLFSVDLVRREITLRGRFSATAPAAARDPSGLFWARAADNSLGCMDPATGSLLAAVRLPYRVYEPLIAANGLAYVCHNTLTGNGFPLSIVDVRSRARVGQIDGILGLRTDAAQEGGSLFIATFGFDKDDLLRLYRIDTASNRARIILQRPKNGLYWRIAPDDGKLYLFSLPTTGSSRQPLIERISTRTMSVVGVLDAARAFPGMAPVDRAYLFDGIGVVPCRRGGSSQCLAVVDRELTRTRIVVPVRARASSIVAADERTIAYLYRNDREGDGGMSLGFIDIPGTREVKTINILRSLASFQRNSGGR